MTNSIEKVFVTGAGGLVGSALCRELVSRGIGVLALLANDESDVNVRDLRGVDVICGDIRNAEWMRECAKGQDAVVHAAAINKMWHRPKGDYRDVNVTGTDHVCRAAVDAGVKHFIHISSSCAMGPAKNGSLFDENSPFKREDIRGEYERSKFEAEVAVREHVNEGLSATIMRLTAVIGPRDIHGTPPGRLIRSFLRGDMGAFYDARINLVDSRDVAIACANAITLDGRGDVYIVGGHNVSIGALFKMLEDETGIPAPTRRIGYLPTYLAACALEAWSAISRSDPGITRSGVRALKNAWHFDSSKAMKTLGYVPRPLIDSVKDTVQWMNSSQR